jgi:hypothetical protein
MLNIKPVNLELSDGAKPYHARPVPVPLRKIARMRTCARACARCRFIE